MAKMPVMVAETRVVVKAAIIRRVTPLPVLARARILLAIRLPVKVPAKTRREILAPAIVTLPQGIQPLVTLLLVTLLLVIRPLANQLQPILSNCLTGELQQTTSAAAERHYSC
jgi:hypothetical protein